MELSEYRQLLVELDLCDTGGLILALYEDIKTVNHIVANLQSDLPDRFQFFLPITDYKHVFPIFFSQAFESLGNSPIIFHVVGLDEISKPVLDSLILSLQNNREAFKKEPYILVFWVTKKIEKEIFYLAPDFFQWILSSYDFSSLTQNAWTPRDENKLLELPVYVAHIKNYLERVVWQYENWQCVQESEGEFEIDLMRKADLAKEFVKLYGETKNGDKKNMDFFVQEFLDNSQASFLPLLGDFGTGKTSFALRFFVRCSKQFLRNSRNRIPIFVNLKHYSGIIDFRKFIIKECFEKFGFPISMPIFQSLACDGAFLFILDGFDEIASVVETDAKATNFRELAKLTFENMNFLLSKDLLSHPFNKVFLTCRTHYFFTENQEKDILTKDHASLYRDIVTKKKFQVARIHLTLFDPDQIRTYLKIKNPDEEREIFRVIRTTYNLLELANRPLLLNMISESVPFIKDFEKFNASSLYQIYINQCIERDNWNSNMSTVEKREWMWSLALKLFFEMQGEGVLVEMLAQEISEYFDDTSLIDLICYETTTRSFLVRNCDGKYSFAHKSFLEYFLAEYEFFNILNRKMSNVNRKYFNAETFYFLGGLIEHSENKSFSGCDFTNIKLDGVRLVKFDLSSCIFSSFSLGDIILDNCDLTGARFENGLFIDVQFDESNCNQCIFTEAIFRNVGFKNIETKGISFLGCNFENQDLMGFSFNNLNISKSTFNNANLRGCSFQYAIGIKSKFVSADIEGVSFICADFSNADFRSANLKDADFGWATLSGANASYCDMTSSNLGAANANYVRFYHAKLVGANLEAGQFGHAIFDSSNLTSARFTNETQINGASFYGANVSETLIDKALTTKVPDWLFYSRPG